MKNLRELRARLTVRVWTWSYDLEGRRQAAAHEQRNLRCAVYCLLLAVCAVLGRAR